MKITRKIIRIDEELCDGCGQCVPACAEGAIQIIDGKAKLVSEKYCDGLGACLGECPKGAISIEEREAEAFDEEEVMIYLEKREKEEAKEETLACGCPSTSAQQWKTEESKDEAHNPSLLGHWPIKLRLVSTDAPYFKNRELVIAADCGSFAYGRFHQDFLQGRAVVTGCPKFDDLQFYQEKLAEIFRRSEIKKIIVAMMEVPCCSGWLSVTQKAVSDSGKKIPIEEKIIGIRGDIKTNSVCLY